MNNDTIAQFLGAEQIEEEEVKDKSKNEVATVDDNAEGFNDALNYVNSNMQQIIDQGMGHLPEVIDVMKASQEPKMYQAISTYIKTLVDANKTYLENNKIKSTKVENRQQGQSTNIQINGENITMKTANDIMDELDDE